MGLYDANLSEDCLFLNIYVPGTIRIHIFRCSSKCINFFAIEFELKADGASEKTVMVHIHGGAFAGGDSSDAMLGPDFLLSEDNIVVVIQYRLGIFGFLNMGFGEYTGNMGLKDQQLALKWIYENIEQFSGNKNEILLFGLSAGKLQSKRTFQRKFKRNKFENNVLGSASVHFQMLNEESRKYFNRAYLMSSSAFSFYAFSKANHVDKVKECSGIADNNRLIEYLKTAESSALSKCYRLEKEFITTWIPTVEPPETVGAFLTKTPDEIYDSDEAPTIDALFSFTFQVNSRRLI